MIVPVNDSDLWHLRVAALRWLQEHPEDPNGPDVKEALIHINPFLMGLLPKNPKVDHA